MRSSEIVISLQTFVWPNDGIGRAMPLLRIILSPCAGANDQARCPAQSEWALETATDQAYPLLTSFRIRRKLGSSEKFCTSARATAFCFQLAMKAQGASSWTIFCTSL